MRKPPVIPPRRPYATDLTDAEWQLLAPLIPAPKPGGRPPIHDRRELVNAIAYGLRAGCAWRLLPHDLPPWQTVYHYFRSWRHQGRWEQIHRVLHIQERRHCCVGGGRASEQPDYWYETSSPPSRSRYTVGLRGLPLSTRRHRPRDPLVPALRPDAPMDVKWLRGS
jgi:transposase